MFIKNTDILIPDIGVSLFVIITLHLQYLHKPINLA